MFTVRSAATLVPKRWAMVHSVSPDLTTYVPGATAWPGTPERTDTGTPTHTWSNRASTSGVYMRTHPLDTACPMDCGWLVPWIPCPLVVKPIHLVPNTPPGLRALLRILNSPTGVGVVGLPMATG